MAATAPPDDEEDAFALPDPGLPEADRPAGGKRGRKPLPAELPRQRNRVRPDGRPEDLPMLPRYSMHRMGEDVSKQLHIEAKVSVLQHVRLKYACRHCDRHAERTPMLTAPMPAQPLGFLRLNFHKCSRGMSCLCGAK